jgi:hypothetical protein
MSIIGYYVTTDDAECTWCHRPEDWPGFEDWECPSPIYTSTEADTPTHCQHCGDLIPHNLTDDGRDYVRAALNGGRRSQAVREGATKLALDQWREAYGDYL